MRAGTGWRPRPSRWEGRCRVTGRTRGSAPTLGTARPTRTRPTARCLLPSAPSLLPADLGRLVHAKQRADLILDLVLLREPLQPFLREDRLAVEADLEDAAATRDERQTRQVIGVVVEDMLRQTGGAFQVPSRRAVFDPHACAVARQRCVLPHLLAVAHPPRGRAGGTLPPMLAFGKWRAAAESAMEWSAETMPSGSRSDGGDGAAADRPKGSARTIARPLHAGSG